MTDVTGKGELFMKTRYIPALVTLSAGLIASIAGLWAGMETLSFMKMLLLVLFIFYILGSAVKLLIDINFKEPEEEEAQVEEGETEAAEVETEGEEVLEEPEESEEE